MSFSGTDLSQAYGPLSGGGSDLYDTGMQSAPYEQEEPPKKYDPAPAAIKPVVQSSKPQMPPPQTVNMQYDQEQKLMNILTEIKKQQKNTASAAVENQSYVDKLYARRKELWKALQISFIVLLAISIHFVIDHYLKLYINNTDLSFERELFIRMLYPLAIVFILWNLKTFVK